jgi:hypothetical protein
MQYQCGLKISEQHINRKVRAYKYGYEALQDVIRNQAEEDVASFGEILKELKGINAEVSGVKSAEGIKAKIGLVQQPELVITFQIFYMSTQFTRAPIGLVAL